MKREHVVLAEARFDPKLKLYLVLYGCWILALTVVGIPLIPLWLVFGPIWAQRYLDTLHCVLTDRSLIVKKGVIFRIEKTIPLDKIQDISLKEGPLLRKLGLAMLKVETAGQSAPQGASEAGLIGVQNVFGFRDRVLDQRDRVVAKAGERQALPAADATGGLLTEIRDSLQRIEHLLSRERGAS